MAMITCPLNILIGQVTMLLWLFLNAEPSSLNLLIVLKFQPLPLLSPYKTIILDYMNQLKILRFHRSQS